MEGVMEGAVKAGVRVRERVWGEDEKETCAALRTPTTNASTTPLPFRMV